MGGISWRALSRRHLVVVLDIVMAGVAVVLAFLLRANLALEPGQQQTLLVAVPVAGVTAHLAFHFAGTYRPIWRYVTPHDLAALVGGATLAVLGFVTCMFLWDRLASVPRTVPVIYWLVLTVGLCGSRLVYGMLVAGAAGRASDRPWEPVLLVGAHGAALVAPLLRLVPEPGWRPVGILDDEMTPGRMVDGVLILGRLGDFRRVVARLAVQGMRPRRVVLAAPPDEIGVEALRTLRKRAYADGIAVMGLADLARLHGARSARRSLAPPDLPAILRRLEARSYPGAKRLADVALSLAALCVLAPLLGVIALALYASIGTPALFRQARAGRGRVTFVLYKFRTMRDALDEGGRPIDDRLRTPWIGRLLRRTRLDELPQLWNVLLGEMSLVGPRPLLDRDLAAMPDGGRERSALRPGITGWAQVHGGALLGAEDKLALDLWYIRHASPWLDLEILLRTLPMLVLGEKVDAGAIARARAALAPAGRPEGAAPGLAEPPARRVA